MKATWEANGMQVKEKRVAENLFLCGVCEKIFHGKSSREKKTKKNLKRVITRPSPVECLGADSRKIISLLPPGAPAGILKPCTVLDGILPTGHVPPRLGHIFLLPVVAQIVYLAYRLRIERGVI